MRHIRIPTWALALAATVTFAASALAGDAVKLSVELPKDLTTVEAGDPGIDVNIVGIDAAGTRVGPAGNTVRADATVGDLVLVTAPYAYHYTPPATISQATQVKLTAYFKENPDVKGSAVLNVVPHRAYDRLVLAASSTLVPLGTSITIEVRGVKTDGTTVVVTDQPITLTGDAVGSIETVSQAQYRYNAPPLTQIKLVGSTVHMRASLNAYPNVAGELSIVLSAQVPPAPPGPTIPPVNPPTIPPLVPPSVPPINPPTVPGLVPTAPAAGDPPSVLWPSGNVKLLVWRVRTAKEEDYGKARILPAPGNPLYSLLGFHKLRFEVERDDVKKVELQWHVAEKKDAPLHTVEADKEDTLRLEKTKTGKLIVVVEQGVPDGKKVVVDLLMTTADGKILTEEFMLCRGKDANNDGEKDKRK